MALARKEAQRLGHDFIGTEHLLRALIAEESGSIAQVLNAVGVGAAVVRSELDNVVQRGPSGAAGGQLPFMPSTKAALEQALEEAYELGHDHIRVEHLLIGLLREEGGTAGHVLRGLGLTVEGTRKAVLDHMGEAGKVRVIEPTDRLSDEARDVLDRALRIALERKAASIEATHLLLALDAEDGLRTRLERLSVDLKQLAAKSGSLRAEGALASRARMTWKLGRRRLRSE